MTFQKYMESGAWKRLDLFPNRNGYKRTFPVEFCAYQAWANQQDMPELGDALIYVLMESRTDRKLVRRLDTVIRSVENSAIKAAKAGPTGVECRSCGHGWKPDGRVIDAKKCPECGSWWLRLKWK